MDRGGEVLYAEVVSTSDGGQNAGRLWAAIAVVAVLVVGALGGYLIGSSQAPTSAEADQARTDARESAMVQAQRLAFEPALKKGRLKGLASGKSQAITDGTNSGKKAGQDKADSELAAQAAAQAEAEAAAAEAAATELQYTNELPSGKPGYVLPEDQRTPGCVGYDAATGACVGD